MKEVELRRVQFGYDPKKIVLEKIDLGPVMKFTNIVQI
jgi:ABC-type multidrug transport system fused ATPase/permease subunit